MQILDFEQFSASGKLPKSLVGGKFPLAPFEYRKGTISGKASFEKPLKFIPPERSLKWQTEHGNTLLFYI